MIGEKFVDIMLKEGVPMTDKEREEASQALEIAGRTGRIYFIERANTTIGFASYIEKKDKIHLNYCFIYKEHRDKTNLLGMRKFFRSLKDKFTWKSRRRNRIVKVK